MLTFPFIGLVLLTFVSLVAVPCNLAAWPLLRVVERVRPQARSPLLLLFVATPWLLGGGVLLSSVADIFFGACDTGEVCLWNENPHLLEHARALVAAPLLLAVLAAALHLAWQLTGARRAIATMDRAALPGEAPEIRLLPADLPVAFAARDKVFVSAALRDALTPPQFRALLLHERAHLRRSDGLCQLAARLASCTLLPPLRGRLLRALTLANEECCDAEAGADVGRLTVAGAILATERMHLRPSQTLCPAFAESFVAERVRALLAPEARPLRALTLYGGILGAILSVFLVGDLLYYLGMMLLYPRDFG